jgi:hypothetical protein
MRWLLKSGRWYCSPMANCSFRAALTALAVAILPKGKVVAGGTFAGFDQVFRLSLVRLHGDPPLRFGAVLAKGSGSQIALT